MNSKSPETIGDVLNFIGMQAHIIKLQDQIILMGKHVIRLQERCDQLEKWAKPERFSS